jgi:chromosome segregation ATPase
MVFGRKPVYVPPTPAPAPAPRPPAPTVEMAIHSSEMRQQQLEARMNKVEADIAGLQRDLTRHRPGSSTHTMYRRRLLDLMRERKAIDGRMAHSMSMARNFREVGDAHHDMADAKAYTQTLKAEAAALSKSAMSVDIGEIENVRDDIADALADTQEVREIMGESYGVDGIDESELEAELEALEAEAGFLPASGQIAQPTPWLNPNPQQATPQQSIPTFANSTGATPARPFGY